MKKKEQIKNNLSSIIQRISQCAVNCNRDPKDISLVAVGKTQSIENIRHVIESGAGMIGENYIQEAREKFDALIHFKAQWHFIGHLQSNKAKYAVRLFDLIHTVDSLKLAKELDKQARKIVKKQSILIQVNISREATKSGVHENEAFELAQNILDLEHLHLKGLMTMPPYYDAPEKVRPYFKDLRILRDKLEDRLNITLKELSMGMTGDFETAIEEGATLVRIGTALFGARQ